MTTDLNEPRAIGAADRDLEAGQPVGEYVVEAKIGEGGFGTVFRAAHPLIGKVVAIKVLNRQYSAQPEMVSRFVAEARSVNQIRNRFIIDIFGFGQLDDGRHYYVMEYLEGLPLDAYLEQHGRLPLADAIPIMRAVGRALDAAHAKGIAHRDLKPENIFLATESDGTLYPKLLDFGIAKLLAADDQLKHKTRTGAPIGTPYYMSPEQCRGRDVDHRTDIYAFGCVTYKLLTGRVPFEGEDYMEILMKQMGDPVPSASALAPELPASVDQVIAWMMAKDPAQRPASVVAAVRALEDAAVAGGVALPAVTATPGSLALSGRTPSAIVPVPSPTPTAARDLAAARTLEASSLSGPAAATPVTSPPAAAPKRRVWTFVALAVGPLAAVVIAVVALKRGGGDASDGAPATTSAATKPRGNDDDGVAAPRTEPEPAPAAEVTITLTGLPQGTSVIDPEGEVLTLATGGDTRVKLAGGAGEIKIGLDHPDLGSGYVMLTPTQDQTVTAPALVPPTGGTPSLTDPAPDPDPTEPSPEKGRPRKDPRNPRKDPPRDHRPEPPVPAADKVPGGNDSNQLEKPVFRN